VHFSVECVNDICLESLAFHNLNACDRRFSQTIIHLDNTIGCLAPGRDTVKHVHPLVNEVIHNVHPYIKISEMVSVGNVHSSPLLASTVYLYS